MAIGNLAYTYKLRPTWPYHKGQRGFTEPDKEKTGALWDTFVLSRWI